LISGKPSGAQQKTKGLPDDIRVQRFHIDSRSSPPLQEASGNEVADRLSHYRAANSEEFRQFLLRWQPIARQEMPVNNQLL
jgi:hypothetical protein